ncbi:MAG: hypothetical protein WC348_03705 [Patescibacteria group bacterium]|jgi:uncharacterized coiled-coil DUF342 family protein
MENDQSNNQPADIEGFKKELEEFIVVAKKDKEKIEALAVKISAKSEEIELYYNNFTEIRTKLSDGQTGLQALLDQSTNLKNKIDQVSTTAQGQLNQITEKVNSINVKIQEIESYHGTTFVNLKAKLSDHQTGLQALLDQSTTLRDSINKINTTAQGVLEQISNKATSITKKVQEIEDYYAKNFLPLKGKIDDEKNGIQATLNTATSIKEEIVKTKATADQKFTEIQVLTEKAGELKQSAKSSLTEIESIKTKSLEFKDSIGETLDLVTASSLTDSFLKRRDVIAKNAKFWRWATLGSIIILGISVLYIYYLQNKGVDGFSNWHSWYRYLFTSPLIYLVYVCSRNYSMERDFEEKYAFKTVLSTSLQAYIKLLSDKFSYNKSELLKFTLTSIERIYKEPYDDKDEMQEVYGGIKNIFNFGVKNHIAKSKNAKGDAEQARDKEIQL